MDFVGYFIYIIKSSLSSAILNTEISIMSAKITAFCLF